MLASLKLFELSSTQWHKPLSARSNINNFYRSAMQTISNKFNLGPVFLQK